MRATLTLCRHQTAINNFNLFLQGLDKISIYVLVPSTHENGHLIQICVYLAQLFCIMHNKGLNQSGLWNCHISSSRPMHLHLENPSVTMKNGIGFGPTKICRLHILLGGGGRKNRWALAVLHVIHHQLCKLL